MSGDAFDYVRPADLAEALAVGAETGSAYLAGGTDLLPLWKVRAEAPARVVDISRLPLREIMAGRSLRLGALARLSEVATDANVGVRWPLIVEAINASASGQVRNMATVGSASLRK